MFIHHSHCGSCVKCKTIVNRDDVLTKKTSLNVCMTVTMITDLGCSLLCLIL